MSANPDPLYIEQLQKRVRELRAGLQAMEPAAQPAPPVEAAQPVVELASQPKPKKAPNAWANAVKHYQELEKARGRNITLKEAMKELAGYKKSMA